MNTIGDLSTDPKFTIKKVCSETGIRAVTLRAWERRYALLSPQRGENQYRKYSEQDIAILRWVKARVDSGSPISSVVQEFKSMLAAGYWPEAGPPTTPEEKQGWTKPPQQYVDEIYQALIYHNEIAATDVIRDAQSRFKLVTFLLEIVAPCLWRIGDAWEHGEIRIATEHYTSAFIRGRLLSLLQSYPLHRTAPKVLCGSTQGEFHEIGSLMLAILLRRDGYRVEYLGPDLPTTDLVEYAAFEAPDLICLSATVTEAALNLRTFKSRLDAIPHSPLFGYGGRAFNRGPGLRDQVPGIFLGENLEIAVTTVHKLLAEKGENS